MRVVITSSLKEGGERLPAVGRLVGQLQQAFEQSGREREGEREREREGAILLWEISTGEASGEGMRGGSESTCADCPQPVCLSRCAGTKHCLVTRRRRRPACPPIKRATFARNSRFFLPSFLLPLRPLVSVEIRIWSERRRRSNACTKRPTSEHSRPSDRLRSKRSGFHNHES